VTVLYSFSGGVMAVDMRIRLAGGSPRGPGVQHANSVVTQTPEATTTTLADRSVTHTKTTEQEARSATIASRGWRRRRGGGYSGAIRRGETRTTGRRARGSPILGPIRGRGRDRVGIRTGRADRAGDHGTRDPRRPPGGNRPRRGGGDLPGATAGLR
jgi:hypothetical protein